MKDHSATPEAKARRIERQKLRNDQRPDPFVERVRLLRFWRERDPYLHPASRATPRFPHIRSIYKNPVFWRHLLPGLRARLEATKREHDLTWHAEMRASAEKWRRSNALAKAPPLPLFSAEDGGVSISNASFPT